MYSASTSKVCLPPRSSGASGSLQCQPCDISKISMPIAVHIWKSLHRTRASYTLWTGCFARLRGRISTSVVARCLGHTYAGVFFRLFTTLVFPYLSLNSRQSWLRAFLGSFSRTVNTSLISHQTEAIHPGASRRLGICHLPALRWIQNRQVDLLHRQSTSHGRSHQGAGVIPSST